jgi:hypothetical protein
MAYKMTAADRRALANIQARERQSQARRTLVDSTPATETEKSNPLMKVLGTANDLGRNVTQGAFKAVEGIVDTGAGVVGAVGGLISKDFQNNVRSFIETDWTGKYLDEMIIGANVVPRLLTGDFVGGISAAIGTALPLKNKAYENSYLEDGGMVEQVAQGVGQMLPAVAVTIATGGLGAGAAAGGTTTASGGVSAALGNAAKAVGNYAVKNAGMLTVGASAAGSATEEAFNDGASYGKGMLYGAASGATEMVTERLLPGVTDTVIGKSLFGGVKKGVAEQGAKRIVKDIVGNAINEGVEEMASEVTNPFRKSIYKGAEALNEFGESEFWKGVAEAGAVGALTSAAFGGTVGKVTQGKGYNGDIEASVEAIKALDEKRSKIQERDGKISSEDDKRINELIDENYKQIERVLKAKGVENMSDTIERYGLDLDFDNEGNYVKTEMAQSEDGAYYSADARGKEERINALLNEAGATAYKGDLTADEKTAWKEVLRAHNKLNELGYSGKSVVIVEKMEGDNALLNEDLIIIGKNMLTNGQHIRRLVHETTHFTEGSKEWKALTRFVFGDGKNIKQTLKAELDEVVDRDGISYGYGITDADVDAVSEYFGNHNVQLTKKQRLLIEEVIANRMGNVFSDSASIDRLCSEQPSLAKRIWERIKAIVDSFGKSSSEREEIKKLRETERLFRAALETGGQEHMANVLHSGGRYDIKLNRSLFDDEVVSTANMRGNADGAVVKSPIISELLKVRHSANTELKAFPKQEMSASSGEGKILHIIEGLEASKIKGIDGATINGYTGRAVREFAMRNNGYTANQISNTNEFMDEMADFMEKAGIRYRFIGLQDVKNATLHYTYNSDGTIKSVVLSAMVKNGDYPVNFDLSSICKKRVAMSSLIDKLARRGSLDNGTVSLTPENIFKINTALKDAGYETACLGCFVESKRYNSLEWAKKFCNKWNAAVKKVNPNATYFGYGDSAFDEESFTLEQAIKIDEAAAQYKHNTVTKRMERALKKYKANVDKGLSPLQPWKSRKTGEMVTYLSDAAKDRLISSANISDDLKTKYLECDITTLNMADVEFLLENGVLPGAAISNKQAVTEMVNSGEVYQHLLRPSDLLTDRGISKLEALPNFHGVLYGHYGSGTPKLMQSYTPYNSEIALLPNKKGNYDLAEYLYTIAGVRMQSFSDFQIQNIYDYLQMVADLAARKLPAHAYTKEISFAKLLGMTGIKVNLSVMFDIDPTVDKEHAGLVKLNPLVHTGEYATVVLEDAQGKWVYNVGDYHTQRVYSEAYPDRDKRFLQSIGFADAVKLQTSEGYTSNCGIIGVGYSNLGIEAMLNDKRIRYIIPYHASSLPADIKTATNIELGTDYTSVQNNTKISGIVDSDGNKVKWSVKEAYKRLKSGKAVIDELNEKIRNEGWVLTTNKAQNGHGSYELYEDLQQTNDPRETAGNYIDWCCSNGTLPVFYEFASHENYYKLIYDYNVYDCVTEEYAPQEAVTNTYPTKIDGKIQAGSVIDGDFNTEHFESIIDKQMAFMNEYGRDLDSDLETLAENIEKGDYSLGGILKSGKTVSIDNLSGLKEKVRRSGAAIDTEYLDAVERGDMETAQRMVDEAAKTAGYDTKAYHGTDNNFGFTEFKAGEGDFDHPGGTIFFASRLDVAETYSGKDGVSQVTEEDNSGNYAVYLNLGNNLTVDCEGAPNRYIPAPEGYKHSWIKTLNTNEYAEYAREKGYDSITFKNVQDIGLHWKWDESGEFPRAIFPKGEYDVYGVFNPNQIKSADPVTYDDDGNVIPLSERFNSNHKDIRHSRKAEPEKHEGDVPRPILNRTRFKTYTHADAEKVISSILLNKLNFNDGSKGEIKNRGELADKLYMTLNTAEQGKRAGVALDIAEYIIQHTAMKGVYDDAENAAFIETVSLLKPYLHSFNLSSISEEMKHRYGKKKANGIRLLWSAHKGGGFTPDEVKSELEGSGFRIDSDNEADIFFEIADAYHDASEALKKKTNAMLDEVIPEEERKQLKQDIVREILDGFEILGKPSMIATMLAEADKKAVLWKEQYYDQRNRGKAINRLFETVDRVANIVDMKKADEEIAEEVENLVKLLRKVKTYRGNIAKNVREIMKAYASETGGTKLYDLISDKLDGEINPFAAEIEEIAHGNGELSTREIEALDSILRNFIHNANNYKRIFLEGKRQEAKVVIEQGIAETREALAVKNEGLLGLMNKIKEDMQSPVWRFERLGCYRSGSIMVKLWKEFQNGFDRQARFSMQVAEHYKEFFEKHKKEVDKWRDPSYEINGQKVSRGQMIGLYLTALRAQGREHLFGDSDNGTVLFTDEAVTAKRGAHAGELEGANAAVSAGDIIEFEASLTDTEREFIKLTQTFFNEISKNAKVETDEAMYGVSNVVETAYYPLRVADDQLYRKLGDGTFRFADLFNLYSPSFNKATVEHARNKLVIENVLDVVNRHAKQMANYYGFASAVKTFNRVYNMKVDGVGNMRDAIRGVDRGFEDYVGKLVQDIQGNRMPKTGIQRAVSKVRGWGARAGLGANLKVLATQFVSMPASAAVGVEYRYVAKGFGMAIKRKTDIEKMFEYVPMLYDRFRNGSNIDVGLLKEGRGILGDLDKLTDITTAPIGAIDSFVCCAVWNACLEQTKGKYTPYSEEHYKAAAELTESALIKTQANYAPLYRPAILREQDSFTQLLTMFMSEPLQQFSLISSSIEKMKVTRNLAANADDAHKEEYEKLFESAKKEAAHALTAVFVDTVILTLIAQLFKWIKGKEDEDKVSGIIGDFVENYVGMFPIIKDVYGYIVNGYDMTNMAYTGLTNIADGLTAMYSIIDLAVSGEAYDERTIRQKSRKILLGISQTFGVPLRNLETYLTGIIEKISPSTGMKYDNLFYSESASVYTDKLIKAVDSGNDKLADSILDIMLDEGSTDKTLRSEMRKLLGDGMDVLPRSVGESITYNGEQIVLTKKEKSRFSSMYSVAGDRAAKLVKTSLYRKADNGVKSAAIKFIYDTYYNLALQEVVGEELESKNVLFAEAMDIEQLAIIVAYARSIEADKDRSGNSIAGSKKAKIERYIQSLGISAAEKYMMMGYLGYKCTNGASVVKGYINRLPLTKAEKERLYEYCGYSV